ncbi:putative DNA-binding domain-containing protein [Ahrensia sp. 13_GOM-1096m]|uniref:HvfC/BufC family peptide modification chaperone n=1 Tax=Ahrensia sp. 13_GOM-1096m TaxID=1380380 RepID=UPI000ACFC7A1|nr:putative DNA-binding domain-containing protein [Ahrensia sp. 13_GOM-1096m]
MLVRFNAMADNSYETKAFAAGMLNPAAPKPDEIIGPNGKAADKRYNVYRNNVTVSLINAVADIYPAVQKIVGEEYFRAMAREYVRAHPPKSPLLFLYGQDFGNFIDGFEPAKTLPYLGDIARIERAWLTAYHAADLAPLDPARLGMVDPQRLADINFTPHPASFIINSDFPVHDIFLMNRGFMELAKLDMANPQALMMTRPQTDTRLILLSVGEHVFMDAILNGKTLGEASALATETDISFDLNHNLQMLLATGATIQINLDGQAI